MKIDVGILASPYLLCVMLRAKVVVNRKIRQQSNQTDDMSILFCNNRFIGKLLNKFSASMNTFFSTTVVLTHAINTHTADKNTLD